MKTKECTMYICEYCGQQYKDLKAVTMCQERCAKKHAQRQQWFKDNPPKYKVGDFVYALPSGGTIEIESITKHPKDNCWRYHGVDETGWNSWISSQYAQLLLSRQQAGNRRCELHDRLQDYADKDIFFAALVKHTVTDVEVTVETRIAMKDKDYKWKR